VSTLHDRESDLSDYRQPRDYDSDRDRGLDREISLGTGTILGIFFALALLCAVFFGFGYSMGRKSAQPTTSAADATSSTALVGGTKPSPGSPLGSSPKPAAAAAAPTSNSDAGSQDNPTPSNSAPVEASYTLKQPATLSVDTPTPVVVKPAPKPVSAPVPYPVSNSAPELPMPQINPNGTVMVQVAAVSHQEDADLLVSALKNRGYTVFIRQEPQDHLLHVQVGPFATRKDADAMRQHLLADGYNAIVK